MNEVKVSVIVPIYNIEDYVEPCARSILSQELDGVEILLIDDGGSDRGGDICDLFAKDHANISVYHKENGGLSDARNYGLERARGKYVMFVDGDDRLLPDALKTLYDTATYYDADIVIGKADLARASAAMERYERIAAERFSPQRVYSGAEYLVGCLERGALRVDVWRSIYKKSYLDAASLRFKCGVAHEDEEFTPRALLAAKRVVTLDSEVYFYNNDRAGSIMNSTDIKKSVDRIMIYEQLCKSFKSVRPRRLKRLLEDDIAWKYMDTVKACKARSELHYNRLLPIFKAYHIKRRIKAAAFALSPNIYSKLF